MQAVKAVTNMLPGGAHEGLDAEVVPVTAATQSNGSECGPHTLMNMRALAKHAADAACLGNKVAWDTVPLLPQGCNIDRDCAWREQLGDECVARQISFEAAEHLYSVGKHCLRG